MKKKKLTVKEREYLRELGRKNKAKDKKWEKDKNKRIGSAKKERKEWDINTKQENLNLNRVTTAPPIGFNGHDFNSKYTRLKRQADLSGIDFGTVYTDLIREKRKNGKQINQMDILGELEINLFQPENLMEEPEPVN